MIDKNKGKESYTAKDIYILKGLEPVRKRPGMYIGGTGLTGLHHLIWECVDNSIDEAVAGYCNHITVTFLPGNKIRESDNGRGIPVDIHPQTHKSALETVLTTLHAGAKFGGKSYKVSGGLHGVGISVVCALSKTLKAEVCRGGYLYTQEYARGKTKTKLIKSGKCKQSGTSITFEPDPEIFPIIKFDINRVINHLRQQAYLTPKTLISVVDAREKDIKFYNFYFEGGIKSYIKYLVEGQNPIQQNIFYVSGEKNNVLVEAAFQYTDERECYEESFANNIYNKEGGTHLTGLRSALTRTLNDYAKKNNFLKSDEAGLTGDDVREGFNGVVSVKLREPQFEGQTKTKLGNPEVKVAVESVVSEGLMDFLERHPQDAKSIIENSILAARARKAAKAVRQSVLRKGILGGLSLPGKLADCSSRRPEESELYIVEGESAGGSAKQARNRRFQAILPLRGKILNVERARLDKILASQEIKNLVIALGTSIAHDFNLDKLRYHKIVMMTDADVDGAHIRTLLLTLFFRYFKPIIEGGYLYIAQPPLYQIKYGKIVKYAYSDDEKDKELDEIKKSSKDENILSKVNVQRYKGLGEMNPEQLWTTTMNPENRILIKVDINDAQEADKIFDILMGKDVLPRKKFIQAYAKTVEHLDI